MLLRVADDYGFKIKTLQHVLEGRHRRVRVGVGPRDSGSALAPTRHPREAAERTRVVIAAMVDAPSDWITRRSTPAEKGKVEERLRRGARLPPRAG